MVLGVTINVSLVFSPEKIYRTGCSRRRRAPTRWSPSTPRPIYSPPNSTAAGCGHSWSPPMETPTATTGSVRHSRRPRRPSAALSASVAAGLPASISAGLPASVSAGLPTSGSAALSASVSAGLPTSGPPPRPTLRRMPPPRSWCTRCRVTPGNPGCRHHADHASDPPVASADGGRVW